MHRSVVIYNMPVSKVHKQKDFDSIALMYIMKKGGRVSNLNSLAKHTV